MFTQTVSFNAGSRSLGAYFTRPDGSGPFPGVLVIHEAWGLNEHIRDIARRFAAEGYAALAVDLFSGRNQVVCMFSLFMGMRSNSTGHGGIRDLRAAAGGEPCAPGCGGLLPGRRVGHRPGLRR